MKMKMMKKITITDKLTIKTLIFCCEDFIPYVQQTIPSPSHEGSCVLGITSCDGNCTTRALVLEKVFHALAAIEKAKRLVNE